MSAADLRRWALTRRAAAREEALLAAAERPTPAEAMDRALELIDLAADLHGWPLPQDPTSEEEDLIAYNRWAKLRQRARPA
jgi:hypothetical protein